MYRTEASEDSYQGVELLLPIALQWRLVEERRRLARAREEDRRVSTPERLRADRDATRPAVARTAQLPAGPDDQLSFIKQFERGVARRERKRRHPVLKAEEVLRVLAKTATVRNRDEHKRELELMEKVKSLGALRDVANPARHPERWARTVASLRASHPHFLVVTDFVVEHVALSMSSRGPLWIPPIHIWGPPGIGKSHYANDLALALGAPLRRQSMENAQTTSLLLGTERHWSTACPGAVFDEIVLGRFANPIFLIDELDKAPTSSTYDPLRPLHSLLEPLTASTIRDAALDITFDASLAIYIAASNDPTKIPESLRSRFSEFEIPVPRGEQALQVAQVVATRTVEKLSVPDFLPPEPRLAYQLAHLTPRAIRKAIQRAVARAIVNDRRYLKPSDLPADVLDDDEAKIVLH
ncbi:AAA family ATPase [Variovorax guangxiensis]|uniref:AAA family ATPase n=1 Tax=Variovorax guangxiensis TaxID=1775474 RepID=UPI00285D678E|nr:AAA family ATPase [Variovorax guangxiensis]MDR6861439.1 ATP-dependent Lon protease [Variovorax guangxiensis]